jgi:dienelactone hydrolase
MDEQTRAKLAEIARKKVIYRMPGMDDVAVRRDIAYQTADDGSLLMDIYHPPAIASGTRVPVVVIVFGYPDPQSGIRKFGPVTSWAQLIAMTGMAAVIYGSSEPADDVHTVLRYLREHAASLELDEQRIGIYSASANVAVALSTLMRDAELKCAALLCGYTFDVKGSTAFADASAQYGFVNACAGRSLNELPTNVPLFVVRAGLEQFPGVNAALDQFAVNALARNLPLTFVNHATGPHGFDVDDDSAATRRIVQQTLAFLRLHLEA